MKKRRKPANRRKTGRGNTRIVEAGKATRFQRGQSGNPTGRPRDVISQEMRKLSVERCPRFKDERTWARAIAMAMFARAISGDVRAFSEICDRVEGKPHQAISLSGAVEVSPPVSVEETQERLNQLITKIRERQKSESEADNQKEPRTLQN
jgi:hypothetical protein